MNRITPFRTNVRNMHEVRQSLERIKGHFDDVVVTGGGTRVKIVMAGPGGESDPPTEGADWYWVQEVEWSGGALQDVTATPVFAALNTCEYGLGKHLLLTPPAYGADGTTLVAGTHYGTAAWPFRYVTVFNQDGIWTFDTHPAPMITELVYNVHCLDADGCPEGTWEERGVGSVFTTPYAGYEQPCA